MYYKQLLREIDKLIISSIGIVFIISLFIGAVLTIQGAYNTNSAWMPKFIIGWAARDSIILEFSTTILALVLAGKAGSNIASEIGTMRVTQQIDAMEIMGVNSAGYLVLPKIISCVLFNPILTFISIIVGIFGGWLAGILTGLVSSEEFVQGLQHNFNTYYILFAIIKTIFFGFLIASISAFHGYYVKGGALDVGKSSTKAVVYSSVLILFFNVLLTQILLS